MADPGPRCEQCHPDCAACRHSLSHGGPLAEPYLVRTDDGLILCPTHAHLRLDLPAADQAPRGVYPMGLTARRRAMGLPE